MVQAKTGLRCHPRSVPAARRFVIDTMFAERVSADLVDTAALLVSELVSNAVLHARSDVVLSVICRRDWARIAVATATGGGSSAAGTDSIRLPVAG